MKSLKKFTIYFTIYILMSIGAVMAVAMGIQPSIWYMIPSILTISLGCSLIEYYAKNYDKFK